MRAVKHRPKAPRAADNVPHGHRRRSLGTFAALTAAKIPRRLATASKGTFSAPAERR
jgi:hypothetical protein